MRADDHVAGAPAARQDRAGVALLWALIAMTTVSLLGAAAFMLTRGERLINDNSRAGEQALYAADQALSQFYANFKPGDNLNLPEVIALVVDTVDDGGVVEIDTTAVYEDYTGTDLKTLDVSIDSAWVRVTPTKLLGSNYGDVYTLEAQSSVVDLRASLPEAVRYLRTYATLVPPVYIRAALNAPNGIDGTKKGNRLILNGTKKSKCGSSASVPGLAVPEGQYDLDNKKVDIKKDSAGIGIDSTTTDYYELRDSLHVDWTTLVDDATVGNAPLGIVIPRDYASLQAMPWKSMKKTAIWPVVLVHGDVTLTNGVDGFGMLIVEGAINVRGGVLKWSGLIMSSKKLSVFDSLSKAHTHITGAVVTGLDCTAQEIQTKKCRDELGTSSKAGEHIGVTYSQCDVQAAWAGMMQLRPLTPSRHIKGDD